MACLENSKAKLTFMHIQPVGYFSPPLPQVLKKKGGGDAPDQTGSPGFAAGVRQTQRWCNARRRRSCCRLRRWGSLFSTPLLIGVRATRCFSHPFFTCHAAVMCAGRREERCVTVSRLHYHHPCKSLEVIKDDIFALPENFGELHFGQIWD